MITVAGLPCISARVLVPSYGMWIAEFDLSLDPGVTVPTSGAAPALVGTTPMTGKVDPSGSGALGGAARVRLVGGLGWASDVPALEIKNDAGVTAGAVATATAAEIAEVVVDGAPIVLGQRFDRTAGPARRVLDGRPWWVNLAGATVLGPRPPATLPPDVDVLAWDPSLRRLTLAGDAILSPGTVVTDARFGTVTIRDLEHVFDATGSTIYAWCDEPTGAAAQAPGGRLGRALRALARESAGVALAGLYRYRVQFQDGEKASLQRVSDRAEAPPFVRGVELWTGLSGSSGKLVPGSHVLVAFIDRDPTQAAVVAYAPGAAPIQVTIGALKVNVGSGTSPVVRITEAFAVWLAGVGTATGVGAPPLDLASKKLFTE